MSRREKRKFIRLMLGLGLSSSVFAAVAATLVWAWTPRPANWTLPPQQIAEMPEPAAATTPDRVARPAMVPITLGETTPPLDVASSLEPETISETEVASVETSADTTSDAPGPIDFSPQGTANAGSAFDQGGGFAGFGFGGFGGMANMGGQGTSWNGTINPNPPPGSRSLGGPSSFGSGGGGGGRGAPIPPDPCALPDAAQNEKCKTTNGGSEGSGGSNGIVVTTVDGGNGGNGPGNGPGNGGNGGDGPGNGGNGGNGGGSGGNGSGNGGGNNGYTNCTTVTSTVNGQTTTNQVGDCPQQPTQTAGNYSNCTTITSIVNGVTTTQRVGNCPPALAMLRMESFSDEEFTINTEEETDTSKLQQLQVVPEPGTIALFLVGLLGLGLAMRRRA